MMKKQLGRPVDINARAARRQQIMDGARKCFVRRGFHASSVAMISQEAGVSVANIYQYFETKDDLIIALAEEEMRNDLALIHIVGEFPTLSAGLKQSIAILTGETDASLTIQLQLEVLAESFRNPTIAKIVKVGEAKKIEALAALLTKAQKNGEIAADIQTENAATLFLAYADGLLSRVPISPRPLHEFGDAVFAFVASYLGLKTGP